MTDLDPSSASIADLLKIYVEVLDALRHHGIMRSSNGPAADFAEYLFCKAFDWEQQVDSTLGFNAKDSRGTLYLIKGRRITRHSSSRELSPLPNLKERPFHSLATVLFNEDFTVMRGALIPLEVVVARATLTEHANTSTFALTNAVWEIPGVTDVTPQLRTAANFVKPPLSLNTLGTRNGSGSRGPP